MNWQTAYSTAHFRIVTSAETQRTKRTKLEHTPTTCHLEDDSAKRGLIGSGTSSCKTELTRQIADSGAAPTKGVTIRYPPRSVTVNKSFTVGLLTGQ